MSLPIQQAIGSFPAPISPALGRKVGYFSSKLTASGLGHEIMADDAPTDEDRESLQRRSVAITHWMTPPAAEWIIKQLMALASVRAPLPGDVDERKKSLRVSAATLGDLPQFALAKAFEAAHRGEVGNNPAYMPTPAELHIFASKCCQELLKERRQIEAVLTAKINHVKIDQERRKASVAYAQTVLKEMRDNELARERARAGREAVEVKIETPQETLTRLLAQAEAEREIPREDRKPIPVGASLAVKLSAGAAGYRFTADRDRSAA